MPYIALFLEQKFSERSRSAGSSALQTSMVLLASQVNTFIWFKNTSITIANVLFLLLHLVA